MKKMFLKNGKCLAAFLLAVLTVAAFAGEIPAFPDASVRVWGESAKAGSTAENNTQTGVSGIPSGYTDYLAAVGDQVNETQNALPVVLSPEDFDPEKSSGAEETTTDGIPCIHTESEGLAVFLFEAETAGFYKIYMKYAAEGSSGGRILRSVELDGEIPFSEWTEVELDRIWTDREQPGSVKDRLGNDIRPSQIEKEGFAGTYLKDPSGFLQEPPAVYLSAGAHTLGLRSVSEALSVSEIWLEPSLETPSYAEQTALWNEQGGTAQPDAIVIQAEQSSAKSDRSLYPRADRSSPLTEPSNYKLVLYNTIGGERWSRVGQWIEWTVRVPEDGFYTLSLRWKQDTKVNDVSARALTIDGELPFKEAASLLFPYGGGWQSSRLQDSETGEAYRFRLSEGTHAIRLEATLGAYAGIARDAQELLYELNRIYRQIVTITGPTPDQFRDYEFDKTLPDTLMLMQQVQEQMARLEEKVQGLTGGGQSTAAISRLIYQIGEMLDDPETIAYRLLDFQNNISGFGAWMNQVKSQPLEIDYLVLDTENAPLPAAEAGVFGVVGFYIRQFLASFIIDYAEIGTTQKSEDEAITVWIGSGVGTTAGRDQSLLIRQMISESFTPREGITARLQLVSMGALLPATLAGIGPDVALQQPQADPLNYALRNAVADLSQFRDAEEIFTRFLPEAALPFRLGSSLYALPETQSYPMLFYRKDILDELGIDESQLDTWDSLFLSVLPRIQKSYLQLGVLSNLSSYAMFLYQAGGAFYTEDGQQSAVASPAGIRAFEKFTGIYTEYKQALTFDFANRFRTGEMPIAINDFTAYNQMSVFAPELKGLWGMRPVPGTFRPDGTIDRSVASTVSGCILLSNSKNPEAAWTFMKWWTEAETQIIYGQELESIMGDAARYPTANLEAMQQMAWDSSTAKNLAIQRAFARAIPEIPGGYFTARHMDFAIRDVILSGRDVRETITEAQQDISAEIVSKRLEFGLEVKTEYRIGGEP